MVYPTIYKRRFPVTIQIHDHNDQTIDPKTDITKKDKFINPMIYFGCIQYIELQRIK